MRRTTCLLPLLLLAAAGAYAHQSRFMNTTQLFRAEVVDFREDGVPGRIRDGVLIHPSPADLEVGDIFIDVDGKAKKVSAVRKVGRDLYIDTVQPAFGDVLLYIDVPQQVISFGAEDGFTVDESGGEATGASPRGTVGGQFDLTLWKSKDERQSLAVSGGLSLEWSDLTLGYRFASVDVHWEHVWWWLWVPVSTYNPGYLSASTKLKAAINAALNASLTVVSAKPENPVMACGFGSPTPGIGASLGLYFLPSMEGTLAISVPLTLGLDSNLGVNATLDGIGPLAIPTNVRSSGGTAFTIDFQPSITAEATFKLFLYLGTKVDVLGFKLVDFKAGGGPYITVTGSASGGLSWNSATPTANPFTGQLSGKGDLGVFVEVSAEALVWKATLLSLKLPLLVFFDESTDKNYDARLLSFDDAPLLLPVLVPAAH